VFSFTIIEISLGPFKLVFKPGNLAGNISSIKGDYVAYPEFNGIFIFNFWNIDFLLKEIALRCVK